MNKETPRQRFIGSHPRIFRDFRYVYPVIARRSGGVSIGVNLSPGKYCNFNCVYCQVARMGPVADTAVNPDVLLNELSTLLKGFDGDNICRLPEFSEVPDRDKKLRDVALSGDGEPTLSANFRDICMGLSEFQQAAPKPFKLVLITNASNLAKPDVLAGLDAIMKTCGEIWAKLDAGSRTDFMGINRSNVSLSKVEAGLLAAGLKHPLHIQTLFFRMNGHAPSAEQVRHYSSTLNRLVAAGCRISSIQLHTIVRKPAESCCRPLEGERLQQYAAEITAMTGLPVKTH